MGPRRNSPGELLGMIGRQALEGSTRPFTMEVSILLGENMPPVPFLRLERLWTLVFQTH